MGPRWLLVFFIATSSIVSAEPVIYGLKGLHVTVNTQVTHHPDEILWKHNGNKVVEYDGKTQQEYGSFKGRVVLDWVSAQLDIQELTYEDSGEYVLEVFRNTNLQQLSYKLEVIDTVTKPTISCEMSNSSSSNTHGNQATLTCSVESRQPLSLMKFEWVSDGNIRPGPKLAITLGGAHDNEEYKCRVSNPLTDETATFTAKDCYADKPHVAVIAILSVLCGICVLALVLGIVFWKRRQSKRNNDLENPTSTHGSNKDTTQNKDCKPLLSPGNNDWEKYLQTTTDGLNKDTTQNKDCGPLLPPGTVKNRIRCFEPNIREPDHLKSEETTKPDPAGSNKKTAQNKDCDPPLSPGLTENTDKNVSPPPFSGEPSLSQDLNNDERHADAEEPKEPDPSNSEETTEPDPAGNNDLEKYLQTTTDGSNKDTTQNKDSKPLLSPGNVKNRIRCFEPNSREPDHLKSEETTEPDPAGSNKETAQNEDCDPPLSPEPSLSQDLNNEETHADAEEPREPDPSNSEETTEPDPAGLNKGTTQNKDCDPLFPPGNVKNRIRCFEPNIREPDHLKSEETTEPDPAGLTENTDKNVSPPPFHGEPSLSQDLNNEERHADAEEPKEPDPSNSEKTTEPDPAGLTENTDKNVSPPPFSGEPSLSQDLNNEERHADAKEPKEPDPSTAEKTTEPDPADPEKMADEEPCLDSSQKNANMEISKDQ